jgi:hypothetical protein
MAAHRYDHWELTDRQLVDPAIAALAEIENRMRKTQRGLRLEIILEFGRRFLKIRTCVRQFRIEGGRFLTGINQGSSL